MAANFMKSETEVFADQILEKSVMFFVVIRDYFRLVYHLRNRSYLAV